MYLKTISKYDIQVSFIFLLIIFFFSFGKNVSPADNKILKIERKSIDIQKTEPETVNKLIMKLKKYRENLLILKKLTTVNNW